MSAMDEVVKQIGTRYLPRGMKLNGCPIHGSYLAHYTQAEPMCPECTKVLQSTNQGNGESATAMAFEIDMRQDAMQAERMRDHIANMLGIPE